ncbi:hypothetical protein [Agarivorans sp. 1_MG-2023]|uniref:DUF6942 family protein n=1 Tax=Agarivorans sp. 1_MG-2023 TaxID=3062634 RepID=UPI0026E22754|nr:hypothetical protein [Agarivorans sp. 1_MG-2023]MDO6763006.1 hypothetical protein [Agarivorans sp. 1_MG-2023]
MMIGSERPKAVLYLNCQPPQLPLNYQQLAPSQLSLEILQNNNNNWRKILTIYAKLTAPNEDWRNHLHTKLLSENQIHFDANLVKEASTHIIAGKNNWCRFDHLNANKGELSQKTWLFLPPNIYLTPYPDYRQFPNILIEECRTALHQNGEVLR